MARAHKYEAELEAVRVEYSCVNQENTHACDRIIGKKG